MQYIKSVKFYTVIKAMKFESLFMYLSVCMFKAHEIKVCTGYFCTAMGWWLFS